MKKLIWIAGLPLLLLVIAIAVFLPDRDEHARATVRVVKGSVARHAVATGRIEARFEVPVKARNGGVLTERFVELGQQVKKDDPLVEVRPVLTDLDRLQAEHALLAARDAEESAEEVRQGENLMGRTMRWYQGQDNLERMRRSAERARLDVQQQLELLREGRVEVEGLVIDYIVRAPIDGHVIELPAEVGQPVVPASSYGSGTQLLILADLSRLVFRGTVNEIDVGRLREGMTARIDVGALPGTEVTGELVEISLRSRSVNNATVFGVKLEVEVPPGLTLRSGYSAVARIELARVDGVLVIPERLVDYRDGGAFVLIGDGGSGTLEKEIGAGLSDGLTVEITEGLAEGDEVLERVF